MSLTHVIEEVGQVASDRGSYAYRYVHMADYAVEAQKRNRYHEDAALLEVRVEQNGAVDLTPCDLAGRRLLGAEGGGGTLGVSTPTRTVRDELRGEVLAGVRAEVENHLRDEFAERLRTEVEGVRKELTPEPELDPEPEPKRGFFARFRRKT